MGSRLLHILFIVYTLLPLLACEQQKELREKRVIVKQQSYSFANNVKPILDKKCLACHACYDAPCQLKLESAEGLNRGASKQRVYDGGRFQDSPPTRLYVDAQTPQEWRDQGFHSVLSSHVDSDDGVISPLMEKMLALGQRNPLPPNKKIPEDIKLGLNRVNYCSAPGEFKDYVDEYPNGGMPLAVSGLDKNEYKILSTWLKQGAKIDAQNVSISKSEQQMIKRWESWLNTPDKRVRLVSRYLYEHLFLAHLYLGDPGSDVPPQFYQLIRSYEPGGLVPIAIPTVLPNDDPEKPFLYRLIPVVDTIVHKTNITYRFDSQRLKRYEQLFLNSDWSVKKLPGYSYQERSNPFLTFEAIPAKQRYLFLLDDAEFFVRNFIRGPVCHGQIATNVIRDQFWVIFEDPDFEHYTNDSEYQLSVNGYLGLPGEKTSILDFGSEWLDYSKDRNHYLALRQSAYQKKYPSGAAFEQLWDGDKTNENAFLTVFRHHDSASVTKGWQGQIPLTVWLMDYPLLERTYYELVVGFNVFGSVSHQAQTRLYFDLIRNGSETNFLRFLPADSRQKIYDSWYLSAARIKTEISYHDLDVKTPSNIAYTSEQPKQELLTTLIKKLPTLVGDDPINRCSKNCEAKQSNSIKEQISHALNKIAAIPASQLAGIKWLPEVSFVRIDLADKKTTNSLVNEKHKNSNHLVYSLLRNRHHDSVAFALGESLRYQEDLDGLTILPEPVGSYPNLILQINISELEDFVAAFSAINSEEKFNRFIERWGVRRMSPQFWEVFHSFKDYMQVTKPLESGIYDMNRYGRW